MSSPATPVRTRARKAGNVQCNVELPQSAADALDAHLEITGVSKRDFVLLAVRHEIAAQRAAGLGLVDGKVPPGGEGLLA